jgi:hypothetical protein
MGHGGRPKAELTLSTWERLTLERLGNRCKCPCTITDDQVEAVILKILEEKPDNTTHWSTRDMVAEMGSARPPSDGSDTPSASSPTERSPSCSRPTPCLSRRVRDIVDRKT